MAFRRSTVRSRSAPPTTQSRILLVLGVAGSLLLTSVPTREAACQSSDPSTMQPCPYNRICTSTLDCEPLRCNLACTLDKDLTRRTCRGSSGGALLPSLDLQDSSAPLARAD